VYIVLTAESTPNVGSMLSSSTRGCSRDNPVG